MVVRVYGAERRFEMNDKRIAEARKWQKESLRRYEWYAAKRILASGLVFLIFFALIMALAFSNVQN